MPKTDDEAPSSFSVRSLPLILKGVAGLAVFYGVLTLILIALPVPVLLKIVGVATGIARTYFGFLLFRASTRPYNKTEPVLKLGLVVVAVEAILYTIAWLSQAAILLASHVFIFVMVHQLRAFVKKVRKESAYEKP